MASIAMKWNWRIFCVAVMSYNLYVVTKKEHGEDCENLVDEIPIPYNYYKVYFVWYFYNKILSILYSVYKVTAILERMCDYTSVSI